MNQGVEFYEFHPEPLRQEFAEGALARAAKPGEGDAAVGRRGRGKSAQFAEIQFQGRRESAEPGEGGVGPSAFNFNETYSESKIVKTSSSHYYKLKEMGNDMDLATLLASNESPSKFLLENKKFEWIEYELSHQLLQ